MIFIWEEEKCNLGRDFFVCVPEEKKGGRKREKKKKRKKMTEKVTNLNYVSPMICTEVLGKRVFLDINCFTFYLKEKCDKSLIYDVFFGSEGKRGKKKKKKMKTIDWLKGIFRTLKMRRGMCHVN